MKTLSIKIFGCAAACALLTTTRAQTSDDLQSVPPPDTSAQAQEAQPSQTVAPNVIVVPLPADAFETNSDAGMNGAQDATQNLQPMQNAQPNQPGQYRSNGGNNQFQGRNNFGRGRDRGNRDSGGQQQRFTSSGVTDPSVFTPPAIAGTNGTDELYLNFHGAPIDQVLNYLSDAAGFIIELDTRVAGTVDVWSAKPVSREEAVQLLNSVLNKNGYAAVRNGRTLRIMSKESAIRGQIPVIIGNDPDNIPVNDEIVTQIIPIRYVQARQLIIDLSSLTESPSIIANDAGNSIIVTDTQANIHHLVELVKAIDGSAEDVTVVKPFHLQFHDPVEVATLISSIYADQSNGQGGGGQAPIRFGGFGGAGGAGGFGGGRGGGGFGGAGGGGGLRALFGGAGGGGQQGGGQAVRQKAKVVAVADQRTSSVIVTAPKDLMPQIEELVTQIDQNSPKVAKVSVYHLENADPIQVQKVLQQFQGNNSRTAQTSQNSPLMQRENQNTSSSSSTGFGTTGGTGFGGGGGGTGFGGGGGGGFGGGGGGGFRGGGQ